MRIGTGAVCAAVVVAAVSAVSSSPMSASEGILWEKDGWRVRTLASSASAQGCQAVTAPTSRPNAIGAVAWGFIGTVDGRLSLAMAGPAGERMIGKKVTITVDDWRLPPAVPRRLSRDLAVIGELPAKQMSRIAAARWLTISTTTAKARYRMAGAEAALSAVSLCANAIRAAGAKPPATPRSVNRDTKSETSPRMSAGTGFYVSASGDVLTNAHVVEGCSAIGIKGHGDTGFRAVRVRASDIKHDLALLGMLMPPINPPAVLAWRRETRLGEYISIFGFPYMGRLASAGTFSRGDIAALAGMNDNDAQFQLSAPVQPGNSGGPVVDERGHVVGVVVGRLNPLAMVREKGDFPQNVNFAIKSAHAIPFMEAHGIAVAAAEPNAPRLSGPDVAERLRSGAVLVMCAGGLETSSR